MKTNYALHILNGWADSCCFLIAFKQLLRFLPVKLTKHYFPKTQYKTIRTKKKEKVLDVELLLTSSSNQSCDGLIKLLWLFCYCYLSLCVNLSLLHTHMHTHSHTCFYHPLGFCCSGIWVSAVLLPQGGRLLYSFHILSAPPPPCSDVRLILAQVRHSAETFTTPVMELVVGLGGTSGLLGEVLVGGLGMLMIAVVTWLLLLQFRPTDSSGIMLRLERL